MSCGPLEAKLFAEMVTRLGLSEWIRAHMTARWPELAWWGVSSRSLMLIVSVVVSATPHVFIAIDPLPRLLEAE